MPSNIMHIAAMHNNKDDHSKDDYYKDDHINGINWLLEYKMMAWAMGPSLIVRPLSFLFIEVVVVVNELNCDNIIFFFDLGQIMYK